MCARWRALDGILLPPLGSRLCPFIRRLPLFATAQGRRAGGARWGGRHVGSPGQNEAGHLVRADAVLHQSGGVTLGTQKGRFPGVTGTVNQPSRGPRMLPTVCYWIERTPGIYQHASGALATTFLHLIRSGRCAGGADRRRRGRHLFCCRAEDSSKATTPPTQRARAKMGDITPDFSPGLSRISARTVPSHVSRRARRHERRSRVPAASLPRVR